MASINRWARRSTSISSSSSRRVAGGNCKVAVIMSASSRKGRAIAAAGRFSICAQQEALPYKYVMAEGPVVSEREGTYDDTLAMATRYLGTELGRQYADANAGGGTIYSMRPERWFSTDYTPD